MWAIRMVALAGRTYNDPPDENTPKAGDWLAQFDPDAMDGYGFARWSDQVGDALSFATPPEAFALYRSQSTVRPLRDDGRPNRPLTAYTITVEKLIDDPAEEPPHPHDLADRQAP